LIPYTYFPAIRPISTLLFRVWKAPKLAILTDRFLGFPQSLQANKATADSFNVLPNLFVTNHPAIGRYISEFLAALLKNLIGYENKFDRILERNFPGSVNLEQIEVSNIIILSLDSVTIEGVLD
jgi:hypothetical protein